MIKLELTSSADDILVGFQHMHEEATETEPSFSILSVGFLLFTVSKNGATAAVNPPQFAILLCHPFYIT